MSAAAGTNALPGFGPGMDGIARTIREKADSLGTRANATVADIRDATEQTQSFIAGDVRLRDAPYEVWRAELYRRSVIARIQAAMPAAADPYTDPTQAETRVQAAISGTFIGMVTAAVTLIIGIYVFAQISSTMPTPQNNQLANATSTVKSTTGQAFTLGAVAIIVVVASLILALVSGFGGQGGGGGGQQGGRM